MKLILMDADCFDGDTLGMSSATLLQFVDFSDGAQPAFPRFVRAGMSEERRA